MVLVESIKKLISVEPIKSIQFTVVTSHPFIH